MLNLFGINVKDAREKVFLSADAKKVLTPKKTMHSATFDGKELSITYRVGKELEQIRDMLDNANNYPPEESFGFILSGEEVADRKDPERRSDEFMYAAPELDTEKVRTLSMDEKMDRFAWFVSICNRLTDPKLLELIIERAPKKKDGTFARNRLTVIAAMPVVFSPYMNYYEVVGKAKDDTHLQLSIQCCTFSDDEWLKTKSNDYLLFIETGTAQEKPQMIKIWCKNNDKKYAIDVRCVKMSDGRLAIDAKPYRAISDFSCVSGNDKKGYEIHDPVERSRKEILCEGQIWEARCDFNNCFLGIHFTWGRLKDMVDYIRTGKQKYRDAAGSYTGVFKNEIPSRCLNENYITENVYQFLCMLDEMNSITQSQSFFEDMAKALESRADLSKLGCDVPVPTAPCREVPLVTGFFRPLKPSNSEKSGNIIRICYGLSKACGDKYSEFTE